MCSSRWRVMQKPSTRYGSLCGVFVPRFPRPVLETVQAWLDRNPDKMRVRRQQSFLS
jgi:Ulp1 family protease